MADQTPRFGLGTFEEGETNWDHTDTVEKLDEAAIERGPIADRPDTGSYDDELYQATDQRILWRWDAEAGDAEGEGDWLPVGGMGSEENPLPGTAYRESVNVEDADIESAGVGELESEVTTPTSQSGRAIHRRDARPSSTAGTAARDYQPTMGVSVTPIHTINPQSDLTVSSDSWTRLAVIRLPLQYGGENYAPRYAGVSGFCRRAGAGDQVLELKVSANRLPDEEPYAATTAIAADNTFFNSGVSEIHPATEVWTGNRNNNGIVIEARKGDSTLEDIDIAPGTAVCLWGER